MNRSSPLTNVAVCVVVSTLFTGASASGQPVEPGTIEALSKESAWKARFRVEELMTAFGFWTGQALSLEHIARTFPDFAKRATVASLDFEVKFGSAMDAIQEEGRSRGEEWDAAAQEVLRIAAEHVAGTQLSVEQVSEFLDDVDGRLKGAFPQGVGETLLSFHPSYDDSPPREFVDGFKREFRTDGSGKSAGLKLAIQIPCSWTMQDGRRPHVVQVFKSKGGHGDSMSTLLVRQLPEGTTEQITDGDIDEMTSESAIQEFAPGARVLERGTTTLAGQHCAWSQYLIETETAGVRVKSATAIYHLAYRDRYVAVQFMVGKGALGERPLPSDEEVLGDYRRSEPLFRLMLISFDILNRYESEP